MADYLKNTSKPTARGLAFTEDPQAVVVNEETGEVIHIDPKLRMADATWNMMKGAFRKGQILITKEAKTVIRHGHAAILQRISINMLILSAYNRCTRRCTRFIYFDIVRRKYAYQ